MPVVKEKSGRWKITCEYDDDMRADYSDLLEVKYECVFSYRMGAEDRVLAAESLLDIFGNVLHQDHVYAHAVGGVSQFKALFSHAKKSVAECNTLMRSLKVILSICMCSKYAARDKNPGIIIEVHSGMKSREFKLPFNRIAVKDSGDYSKELEAKRVLDWERDVINSMSANNVFV